MIFCDTALFCMMLEIVADLPRTVVWQSCIRLETEADLPRSIVCSDSVRGPFDNRNSLGKYWEGHCRN